MNLSASNRSISVQCVLDRSAPRPNAFEIHDGIFDNLKLPYEEVDTCQLDFVLYSVFLKFMTCDAYDKYAPKIVGQPEFRHRNGTISKIQIVPSGFGVRNVRVFNVPPECPNEYIARVIGGYGTVLSIVNEKWGPAYKYPVNSGVRSVTVNLRKHIPSYLTIAGTRAQIQYSGQPITCAICQSQGHLTAACPNRRPAQ